MSHSVPSSMDVRVEQTLWDGFWLPPWAHTVDRPELRYTWSDADQPGLNQVSRVRDGPTGPGGLAALVEEVDHAHRGRHSTWLLAPHSQRPGLPALLHARGWRPGPIHHLRSLATDVPLDLHRPELEARPVCDDRTLIDCITVSALAFGRPPGSIPPARIADELGAIQRGRVHRFVAYDRDADRPVASGGLNTYPQLGIGFLWGGGTIPDHRGRGAYRLLLQARLDRAAREGCSHVAVYARHDTSDPILDRLGFVRHGSLHTWERAPS